MRERAGRLKKDWLLISVGIALPLLVVLLFLLATNLPRLLVPPPRYDFLFASYASSYPQVPPVRVNLDVYQGRVRARVYQNQGAQVTRLFLFDHRTSTVREIPVSIPDQADTLENGSEIQVPEVRDLRLDPGLRAPDGYEFRGADYRGGGIFSEILGVRRRRSATIARKGAVIPVPLDPPLYSIHFLGWIVPGHPGGGRS